MDIRQELIFWSELAHFIGIWCSICSLLYTCGNSEQYVPKCAAVFLGVRPWCLVNLVCIIASSTVVVPRNVLFALKVPYTMWSEAQNWECPGKFFVLPSQFSLDLFTCIHFYLLRFSISFHKSELPPDYFTNQPDSSRQFLWIQQNHEWMNRMELS